jgi:hypothetical protein
LIEDEDEVEDTQAFDVEITDNDLDEEDQAAAEDEKRHCLHGGRLGLPL